MAVAVGAEPHVVLDEEYRIVEVGPAARAGFTPLLGENILDSFPDSRPLFLPYYEEARRTRQVIEFAQYYDGYVLRVKVVPDKGRLTVSWETLGILDVLTLDGLRASLDSVLQALAATEENVDREHVRQSLRVVAGEQ